MSEPKNLPTLWVTQFGAEFLRKPSAYSDDRSVSARTEALPDGIAYVPASSLSALEAENAALRALLGKAFGFTCHDHYVGPCATEERPRAACTCGLDTLHAEWNPKKAAALTPAKETT